MASAHKNIPAIRISSGCGIRQKKKKEEERTQIQNGIQLPFSAGVFFTFQPGGKMESERKGEDAQKPEPGVFVSECATADVNSVPL